MLEAISIYSEHVHLALHLALHLRIPLVLTLGSLATFGILKLANVELYLTERGCLVATTQPLLPACAQFLKTLDAIVLFLKAQSKLYIES